MHIDKLNGKNETRNDIKDGGTKQNSRIRREALEMVHAQLHRLDSKKEGMPTNIQPSTDV